MTTALHALSPLPPLLVVPTCPDVGRDLDHLIGQHHDRVHAARLAVDTTTADLHDAQERVRALQLELGNQQQELCMAGKELQALVTTRDIVARAYGGLG